MSSSSSSGQAPTTEHPDASASGDSKTNYTTRAKLQSKLSDARRKCLIARTSYATCAKAFASNNHSMASMSYSAWRRPFEHANAPFPLSSEGVFAMYNCLRVLEEDFWEARRKMEHAQRQLDRFTTKQKRASKQESEATDMMGVNDSQPKTSKKRKTAVVDTKSDTESD